MRLLQIEYFLEIAKQKSITKAASVLYISQPALSKQMNLLEEELGVKLLRRLPRGILLTAAGEQFAQDCARIMRDLDAAVGRISTKKSTAEVQVRIGCFDGVVVDDFLPALYQHIRDQIPDVRIKLSRRPVRENREAFLEDELDLQIELAIADSAQDPFQLDYCSKVLAYREGALIYSKASALAQKEHLTLKDFEKETFLVPSPQDSSLMAVNALKNIQRIGISNPLIEYEDNIITLMSNLTLGNGYCVLAKLVADTNPNLMAFRHPDLPGMNVVALWKQTNALACRLMEQ